MAEARWIVLGSALTVIGASLALEQTLRWLGAGVFGAGAVLLVVVSLMAAHRNAAVLRTLGSVAQKLRESPDDGELADSSTPVPGAGVAALAEAAAGRIRALHASERDLRAAFDAVDVAVVATDSEGTVLLCNAAAGEFVGRPAPSLIARRIDELFTQAELLELHRSALDGHSHSRQVRIPRPSGPRVFDVFVSPLKRAAAASGAIVTLRDVTELARSVQVKTDFVVNASHEMRTPIAALRMASETLEGGAAEDPAMLRRLLAMISGHVSRLEDLTHDLLDLSRLESPELQVASEPVPASELAEEFAQLFADACRQRGLTLAFDFDPALEAMWTDRTLILLILKNLIDNATKFADEGSTVRVVGRPVPNGPWAGVRFEVIDRGLGIPLNQQDRIFERFYQIDEARAARVPGVRRGTGLGLAIVKHAVRTLGGQIRVQSVWKRGTTMIVEIPEVLPPAGEPAPVPQRTFR